VQTTKQLMNPIYLDNAVILSRQEYERLYRLDVTDKVMAAKKEITEGKVYTHEQVMDKLNKMLEDE
jgi:hypothetical protein